MVRSRFGFVAAEVSPKIAIFIASAFCATAALAQSAGADASIPPPGTVKLTMSAGKIFTYFMVMLGPIKLVGPFAKATKGIDNAECRRLAVKAFGIACLAGLAAAFVGRSVLDKWGISMPALLLAAGLVLLLVALQAVLSQYSVSPDLPAEVSTAPSTVPTGFVFSGITFPHIITPYGTAALILILSAAPDQSRVFIILGIFLVVMVLNLAAMWFARPIVKYGSGLLSLLGAVLGVLQVALAMQMLVVAGRMLRVLPPL